MVNIVYTIAIPYAAIAARFNDFLCGLACAGGFEAAVRDLPARFVAHLAASPQRQPVAVPQLAQLAAQLVATQLAACLRVRAWACALHTLAPALARIGVMSDLVPDTPSA